MTSNTDKPAKGGKLSDRLDALKSAFDTFTNPNIARNAKELGFFAGAIAGLVSRSPVIGLVTAPTVAVAFDNWQDAKEAEVLARLAAAMDSPSGDNTNANQTDTAPNGHPRGTPASDHPEDIAGPSGDKDSAPDSGGDDSLGGDNHDGGNDGSSSGSSGSSGVGNDGDEGGIGGRPIVLDLDGDGVELTSLDESSAFYRRIHPLFTAEYFANLK